MKKFQSQDWSRLLNVASLFAQIGVLVTIAISLYQLNQTSRTISMNTLSTLEQVYSHSRTQFLSGIAKAWDQGEENLGQGEEIMQRIHTTGYLRSIENVCSLYIGNDTLSAEGRKYVENFVRFDIEDTLFFFYHFDGEDGYIRFTENVKVPWITRDTYGNYPATGKCLEKLDIALEGKGYTFLTKFAFPNSPKGVVG